MLEALQDIRKRLIAREYHNEEHVRFALVGRIVAELGWNIWNPTEVYTEFKATRKEDNTRVDVALFARNLAEDTIFIECKAVGRVHDDLAKVETQLRDYNRDHTALFTIITDGQHWRFYFSFTNGEFAQKLFHRIDLVADDLTEAAAGIKSFLSRDNILNGSARQAAESYLMLSKKERLMADFLPEAEKHITQPPFPSLPEALSELLCSKGLMVSRTEAAAFLAGEARAAPIAVEKVGSDNREGNFKQNAVSGQMPTFHLRLLRSGIGASAQWSNPQREKFIVSAGSTAAVEANPSLHKGYAALRRQLITEGVLQRHAVLSQFVFTQSYGFDNATQAGAVICGYPVNGRTIWKNEVGETLESCLANIES